MQAVCIRANIHITYIHTYKHTYITYNNITYIHTYNTSMYVGVGEFYVRCTWVCSKLCMLAVHCCRFSCSAYLRQYRLDSSHVSSFFAAVCHDSVSTARMHTLCWTTGRSQWCTVRTFRATPMWPSPSTLTTHWKAIIFLPCGQRRKPKQSMPSCAPSLKTLKARGPPISALH